MGAAEETGAACPQVEKVRTQGLRQRGEACSLRQGVWQKGQVLPAPDLMGSAHKHFVRCSERPARLDRLVGMLAVIALTAMCLPAAD